MDTVKTDLVSRKIAELIKENRSRFFTVTFVKKNGELRTLTGHIRKVEGHDGPNNQAHYEKYVTVVLTEKDEHGNEQWRNVNTETIVSLSIAGKKIEFKYK